MHISDFTVFAILSEKQYALFSCLCLCTCQWCRWVEQDAEELFSSVERCLVEALSDLLTTTAHTIDHIKGNIPFTTCNALLVCACVLLMPYRLDTFQVGRFGSPVELACMSHHYWHMLHTCISGTVCTKSTNTSYMIHWCSFCISGPIGSCTFVKHDARCQLLSLPMATASAS